MSNKPEPAVSHFNSKTNIPETVRGSSYSKI